MVTHSAFQKLFLLLPLAYPNNPVISNTEGPDRSWNYIENGADWVGTCESGRRQSPIALSLAKSIITPLPRLNFGNYDIPLRTPLILENNGHSVNLELPETKNGKRASISGGLLNGVYEAIGMHLHWGSKSSRGSEHLINQQQYDAEMHIVHKNKRYDTVEEATKNGDGIAVLGVMLKIVDYPDRVYPGLNKVFNHVSEVTGYHSTTELSGSLTVGQLLGDLDTRKFFTYKGSLTTPTCAEAVTWFVFPNALPIPRNQLSKLWEVEDDEGIPLTNNYRIPQPRNNRLVFFRSSKDISKVFLG